MLASLAIVAATALSVGRVAAQPEPTPPPPETTDTPSELTSEPPTTPSTRIPDRTRGLDFETAVRLSPTAGPPGTQVTITAAGYQPCTEPVGTLAGALLTHPVLLVQWDGAPVDLTQASVEGRDVVIPYTVPRVTAAGTYVVTVTCAGAPPDTATFTVAPAQQPALTLDRAEGHRGSDISVSGSDFPCASSGTVELLWDGAGEPLAEAPAPEFTVTITVPDQASIGGHTVVGRCRDDPTVSAMQSFDVSESQRPPVTSTPVVTSPVVVPSPPAPSVSPASGHSGETTDIAGPPPSTTPPTIWIWLIVLIGAIAAGFGVRHMRRRPNPPTRVRVVAHPAGPPIAGVRETPARGESTHALRLEVHADPGSRTIREVNDDDARPR